MRFHTEGLERARIYQQQHSQFSMSVVTHFEVLRGLRAARAARQEAVFAAFANNTTIYPLTDAVFARAIDVYADLHRRGRLIADADLLIACTALEHGMPIATNNESHFSRIPGLRIDNWLRPS